MQGQVKTYRGSQTSATNQFRRDAARMAANGLVPTSQTWAAGSYGCGSFVLAFLLCFILVGFLIFLYMLIVKPAGTLTVTYAFQAAAPAAGTGAEKVCPRCAEHVKAAAAVCRFCGFSFPEPVAPPMPEPVTQAAYSDQSQRQSPAAVQAGREFGQMWSKKWVRVTTYVVGAYLLVAAVVVSYVNETVATETAAKRSAEAAASQSVDAASSKGELDAQTCSAQREAQLAKYVGLKVQGKDWEAAGAIRICADVLNDPDLKRLVAAAEVQSHQTTISDPNASKEDKLRAMQMLVRDYPEVGKPYEPKIKATGLQIAKEQAAADLSNRRKTRTSEARSFTPSRLRAMVAAGTFPKEADPTSTSKPMEFESCRQFVQMMMSQVQPTYPVRTIVDTGIVFSRKTWANDGAVMVTCSSPDQKLITTTSPYQ